MILLGLIVGVGGSLAVLRFVRGPSYEYSHSDGMFWRVSRSTGVRETATPDGWKTDAAIDAESLAWEKTEAAKETEYQQRLKALANGGKASPQTGPGPLQR